MDSLIIYANDPNVQHNNAQPAIIKLNIAFIACTDAVIIFRILVRWRIVKHVAVEDYLMIAAGVFATAFSVMNIVGTHYGLGRHIYDLPPAKVIEDAKKVVQTLWICQVMYASALTLVKLSIISSYHRIFATKSIQWTMYVLAGLIAAVWVINVLATIFQCTPIEAAWNFQVPGSKCIAINKVYYFSTAFSILTDLLLCVLPLPLFWKLKLPVREKWIVSCLFSCGLFASVASIMRITVLHEVQSPDVTMGAVSTLNWSVAEVDTGAILASLPCLKPLIKRLLPGGLFRSDVRPSLRPGNTGPGLSGKLHAPGEEARELTRIGTSHSATGPMGHRGMLKNSTSVRTREFV